MCGILFGIASDLADHHDRLGVRIGFKGFERLEQRGSHDGITASAETGRETDVGEFAHELISECAGFGYQSQRATRDDAVGNDAKVDAMCIGGFRQGEEARTVRPDDAHAFAESEFHEIGGVRHGDALGDHDNHLEACFDGFDNGVLGETRGNEHNPMPWHR